MKKAILLLIIVSMFFSVLVIAEDTNEHNVYGAIHAQFLLDITGNDYTPLLSKKLTRIEMAKFFTELVLNKCNPMENKEDEFYIDFVVEANLMTFYSDGRFMPQKSVSVEECIGIMVKLIGKEHLARSMGGFPIGHKIVAAENRLLSGLKDIGVSEITWADFIIVFYNALDVTITETVAVNSYRFAQTNQTVMNKYLELYRIRGIMLDNGLTKYNEKSKVGKNQVVIGDITFSTEGKNYREFLGLSVYVYFKDDNGILRIVYLEDDGKNIVTTLRTEEIIRADSTSIDWENNNGRLNTTTISSRADYVKNGIFTLGITSQDLKPANGVIKIIDNNSDNIGDLVIIESYESFLVDMVDGTKIINQFSTDPIDVDAYSTVEIIKNGVQVSITEIRPFDVLAVYRADNYLKIDICTFVVNCTITETFTEGEFTYAVSDGEAYKISEELLNSSFTQPEIGMDGSFYIGKNGEVVYFEFDNTKRRIGIITALGGSNGLTPEMKAEIFTSKGTFEVFEIGEKINFNGNNKFTSASLKTEKIFWNLGTFIRQPIEYELDSFGIICKLVTADPSKPDEDVLQEMTPKGRYQYRTQGIGTFAPGIYRDVKTLYFDLPPNIADKKMYRVHAGSIPLSDFDNVELQFYNTERISKEKNLADIIVRERSSSAEFNDDVRLTVVDYVSNIVDEDGDFRCKLVGYQKDQPVEFYSLPGMEINGLKKGDVILVMESNNEILSYKKYYSPYLNKHFLDFLAENPENKMEFYYFDYKPQGYITQDFVDGPECFILRSSSGTGEIRNSTVITGEVIIKNGNFFTVKSEKPDGTIVDYKLHFNELVADFYRTVVTEIDLEKAKVSLSKVASISPGDKLFIRVLTYNALNVYVIKD